MTDTVRTLAWARAGAAVVVAVFVGARTWNASHEDAPAPATADAPRGRLIDMPGVERSGRALRTGDLAGKLVVADFVFTSCSGMCPTLAKHMATVQDATKDRPDVQIVSFTVDPDRDQIGVMAKYAAEHGFDPSRWWFVRTDIQDLKRLMVDELGLVSNTDPVLHTDRFVLFDKAGAACGVYRPLEDADWRTKLLADVERLSASAH